MKSVSRRTFLTAVALAASGCGHLPSEIPSEIFHTEYIASLPKGNITFTHGMNGSQGEMSRFSYYWNSVENYNTLNWDVPSESRQVEEMSRDLDTLIMQKNFYPTVGVGNSVGGMALLDDAIKNPDHYLGIVLIASGHRIAQSLNPASWQDREPSTFLDEVKIVADIVYTRLPVEKLQVPTIMYVGENDQFFSLEIAEELRELAPEGIVKKILVFEGEEHTFIRSGQQPIFDELKIDIPSFFVPER